MSISSGRIIAVSMFDQVPYQESYQAMSSFAKRRSEEDLDQIWVLQHPAVYTQGTACTLDAFLPSNIETIKTDRGGQITYHGPGQIVMYPMLALKRYAIGVKSLVFKLEQCMIDTLLDLGIEASRRDDAPGVYVGDAKIGALGLRIRKGTSYHGLSLNLDMDLSPFNNIDPCGYEGLKVTNIVDHVFDEIEANDVAKSLLNKFVKSLSSS
jgi:lipoyl(octanoyl) transferase